MDLRAIGFEFEAAKERNFRRTVIAGQSVKKMYSIHF